jgi:hypothetical protein
MDALPVSSTKKNGIMASRLAVPERRLQNTPILCKSRLISALKNKAIARIPKIQGTVENMRYSFQLSVAVASLIRTPHNPHSTSVRSDNTHE